MKVILDSNLHMNRVLEPPVELNLEGEAITLRDILKKLASRCASIEFLTKDGEYGRDVDEMFINDKSYFTLPQGLQTCLKEGDRVNVKICMEQLGGG